MSTTVLAYVILLMGFITLLGGLFGALILIFEEVAKTGHVPFRYYAMMVGLISGGLGMIGIGQGLRPLLLILGKGSDGAVRRLRHLGQEQEPKAPGGEARSGGGFGAKSNGDNLYLLLKKKMSGQERTTRIHSRNPSTPG